MRPTGVRKPIDWGRIFSLCSCLGPLLLALTWYGTVTHVRELQIASMALFAVFLLIERRAVEPLIVLNLFRDVRISLVSASIF